MANTDQAREELQQILQQNEYQVYYEDNRNFLEVLWDRVTEWLGEILNGLFAGVDPAGGFADAVLVIIIAAVLILLGVVLIYRFRHYRRSRGFTQIRPLQSIHGSDWSFDQHLQAVQRQEENQDYTEAARHMFLALLLYFHEREWLKARNWKTNWEYFAELQAVDPHLADSFYRLALVFDEVFYGERTLSKDDYVRYRDEAMEWLDDKPEEVSGEG